MTRRIAVLYTGGTIGMVSGEAGLRPDPDFRDTFIARFGEDIHDWHETPALLDSSVMDRDDWVALARGIRRIAGSAEAVVLLHGTDTMAWTASALSFLLLDLEIPIVLTGAQVPMVQSGSDGPANIALALQAARDAAPGRVVIAFGGKVLSGVRAVKTHAQSHEAFAAPNGATLDWTKSRSRPAKRFQGDEIAQVGVLRLFPGCNARVLTGFAGSQGLIIEAFGSGNLPGEGTAFYRGLRTLRASGCEVAVVTQTGAGTVEAGLYAAGAAVAELELIACADMMTPAAATKLGWLLAQGLAGSELREAMLTPLAGELTP